MTKEEFGLLLDAYPDILDDKKKFSAVLRDTYPTERENVNLLITAYSTGIIALLRNNIDDDFLTSRITVILSKDYNIAQERAAWAAEFLVDAFYYHSHGIFPYQASEVPDYEDGKELKSAEVEACAQADAMVLGPSSAESAFMQEILEHENYWDTDGVLTGVNKTLTILHIPSYIKQIPGGSEAHEWEYFIPGSPGFFEGNEIIEEVYTSPSMKTIELGTFSHCAKLRKVVIAEGTTEICDFAFYRCEKLEQVVLPNSLTKIGKFAFAGCKDLRAITLPGSLEWIGEKAFEDCSNLGSLTIKNGNTAPHFYEDAFDKCHNLKNLIVETVFVDSIMSSLLIRMPHFPFTSIQLPLSSSSQGYSIVQVPEGEIKVIKCEIDSSGVLNSYMQTGSNILSLPNKVEIIAKDSFPYPLETSKVFLPAKVKLIEPGSFSRVTCSEFVVDKDNKNYISVDGVLFSKDMKQLICYPCKKEGATYLIPSGVNEIVAYAFPVQCPANLFIPDSVTIIDKDAIGESVWHKKRNIRYPTHWKKSV